MFHIFIPDRPINTVAETFVPMHFLCTQNYTLNSSQNATYNDRASALGSQTGQLQAAAPIVSNNMDYDSIILITVTID